MNKRLIPLSIICGLLIGACGPGDSELSKSEEDKLRNPSKTMPPEAVQGMSKYMGAGMEAQKKRNEEAGVDPSGVPLDKSKWNKDKPPQ